MSPKFEPTLMEIIKLHTSRNARNAGLFMRLLLGDYFDPNDPVTFEERYPDTYKELKKAQQC